MHDLNFVTTLELAGAIAMDNINTNRLAVMPLSWQWIEAGCSILTDKIKEKYPCPNEIFKGVVAFPRGGLVPATILAHMLDIKTVMTTSEFDMLFLVNDGASFDEGHYLLVDDISDTGVTFADWLANYAGFQPAEESGYDIRFTTVALTYRPNTAHMPDFVVGCADNYWIEFPWEVHNY